MQDQPKKKNTSGKLPSSISYSQVNTYMECPRRYYLTYVKDGYKAFKNKYTELGSLLHEIFELQGKNEGFTFEKALEVYNSQFLAIKKDMFENKEDRYKQYQKGMTALKHYFMTYQSSQPLYTELKLKNKIAKELPVANSIIDRVDGKEESPHQWTVTDYKTGATPKSKQFLRDDIQLGFYAAQIFAKFKEYPLVLQYYHPTPNKFQRAIHLGDGHYEYQNQRKPVVTFSVADTIGKIKEVVTQMKSAEFNKKPDARKCQFCPHFQKGCQPFGEQQLSWLEI